MNHLENSLKLLARWREVPPERVHMTKWTCGSAACLGGWVAQWPDLFPGVTPDEFTGAPKLNGSSGAPVAAVLFGDYSFFMQVQREERPGSEYEIAKRRIEANIGSLLPALRATFNSSKDWSAYLSTLNDAEELRLADFRLSQV